MIQMLKGEMDSSSLLWNVSKSKMAEWMDK